METDVPATSFHGDGNFYRGVLHIPIVAASPARSLFEALPGFWMLHREIEDARLGAGTLDGGASFTPQPDGRLLYEERGDLQFSVWRGPAWRRWIYALEGNAVAIRYPETLAELHIFPFAVGKAARHTHVCGADRYHAELARGADGSLSLAYSVKGPAKDYQLRTLLMRA